HESGIDGAAALEEAIRQRRLAVVDVRHDGDVADAAQGRHRGAGHRTGCDMRVQHPLHSPVPLGKPKETHDVANIKSQIKRNKQNAARHERNKAVRSELKTRVKNAVSAAEAGGDDVAGKATLAQK